MPDSIHPHEEEAARLLTQGKLEEALAEYRLAVEAEPRALASQQKVVELLHQLGRRTEALTTCETLATELARQRHPLRAFVLYKLLRQFDPTHVRTQQVLADLYARPDASRGATPSPSTTPQLAFFSQLERPAFLGLLEALEPKTFESGQSVVVEGEQGHSMFALAGGRVDVVRQVEGGERRTVATLGEGELFGEMALVSEGPRQASVVATERVHVLELTRSRLDRLALRHPAVGQAVQDFYRNRLVDNVLRTNPIFSTLAPAQRQAVAQAFELKLVEAGQVLLTQGQAGDALYLVLRGQCAPIIRQLDGQQKAFASLREGDVFGEISLLLGQPATATVRAETPCHLLRLGREAFEQHVLSQPGVRAKLMRLGTERLLHISRVLSGRAMHEGDLRV